MVIEFVRRAAYFPGEFGRVGFLRPPVDSNHAECLCLAYLFESIAELRTMTDTWLRLYNEERPHDSLGRVPPLMFLPRSTTRHPRLE